MELVRGHVARKCHNREHTDIGKNDQKKTGKYGEKSKQLVSRRRRRSVMETSGV